MHYKLLFLSLVFLADLVARVANGADSMFSNILAFRDAGTYTDFTLVAADGRTHACHRLVLAARSDYWRAMFAPSWKESGNNWLEVQYSYQALQLYLDFIYKSKKTFNEVLSFELYSDLRDLATKSMDQDLLSALSEAAITFDKAHGEALNFAVAHNDKYLMAQLFNALNADGVGSQLFAPIVLFSLSGHTAGVWEANFSQDGASLVTASADKTAKIWNVENGILTHTLTGHTDIVFTLQALGSDGKSVLTSSRDKMARIWHTEDGALIHTLNATSAIFCARFNHNDKFIIAAFPDKTAKIWNTLTDQWAHSLSGHASSINHASFSHDSKFMITASDDKTARIWRLHEGKPELVHAIDGHTASVQSAQFSSDDKTVVTASDDNSAKIWNVQDGTLMRTLIDTRKMRFAKFSQNGKWLITAAQDKAAKIWNVETGELTHVLTGHAHNLKYATFSPDNHLIATASFDDTAKIWIMPPAKLTDNTGSAHGIRSLMRVYLKTHIKKSYEGFKTFVMIDNPSYNRLLNDINSTQVQKYLQAFFNAEK